MKIPVVIQRKIVEFLAQGHTHRQIAKRVKVSPTTIGVVAKKLNEVQIPATEVLNTSNQEFIDIVQTGVVKNVEKCKSLPDFTYIHDQMKIRDMTLKQLWLEFKEMQPDCVSYSRFARLYKDWSKKLHPSMRQHFTAGQTLLVDFCGKTMPIHDINSGKVRNVQIFVGVLGASSLITVIAVDTQQTNDWLKCFTSTFDRICGVPREVITDNLKAAVIKTGRNGTEFNKTFEQFAEYHDFAILNTRPRTPQDKGLAEVSVQIIQRSVLVKLRNRKFFSLDELQKALDVEVDKINRGVTTRFTESRWDRFHRLEKNELLALPIHPYPFAKWIFQQKVSEFYQFTVDGNIYSVPYTMIGKKLDIGITDCEVHFFHENEKIASHNLLMGYGEASILEEHMPANHRLYNTLSPASIKQWSKSLGNYVYEFVDKVLNKSKQLARNIRSLNKLRDYILENKLDSVLNQACEYALKYNLVSVTDLLYILKNRKYIHSMSAHKTINLSAHANLRGADYFGGDAR
ncbi:IS21 family transposase [Acinetobacter rathckeae]|uniref:IS21 family transposase n=1 Tax=Acinetobacter rathckeae TaxID=2605272 RepID=UPI0018A2DB13|nr:IS21 family transposase [Acinetobacter rathckeae]MBF7695098.1 IS21 family transposase [Acinetobacter rathckeae]